MIALRKYLPAKHAFKQISNRKSSPIGKLIHIAWGCLNPTVICYRISLFIVGHSQVNGATYKTTTNDLHSIGV